ncbi:MAG: hypothetical protein RR512_02645 [Coprobacillus sp.]
MVDIIFMVSIFDLTESTEFTDLCSIIGLDLNLAWLEEKYDSTPRGQGNALLFYSNDKSHLLFLNLFQEPTDQNEMIVVGIRCKEIIKEKILEKVMIIYNNAAVKSANVKVDIHLLDEDVLETSYPKIIPTITCIDGKEVYEYKQYLEVY